MRMYVLALAIAIQAATSTKPPTLTAEQKQKLDAAVAKVVAADEAAAAANRASTAARAELWQLAGTFSVPGWSFNPSTLRFDPTLKPK